MRRFIQFLAVYAVFATALAIGIGIGSHDSYIFDHLPTFGVVAPLEAQAGTVSTVGFHRTFTAQTATGATTGVAMRGVAIHHTALVVVTGGPATCTYRLQGSDDGTNWYNISAADLTCTSTITGFETGKPAMYVRGNLLTLTGGTSPTITLHYVGR